MNDDYQRELDKENSLMWQFLIDNYDDIILDAQEWNKQDFEKYIYNKIRGKLW